MGELQRRAMLKLVLCDVGLGNLRSVERALDEAARRASRAITISIESSPEALRNADVIVMPGQGAFRDCATALDSGFAEVLRERIGAGTPYLGICLGLQVLFEGSEEAPGCRGLGIFQGNVVRLTGGTDANTGRPLKIPHVGWNEVVPSPSVATTIMPTEPEHFYFVHSYAVAPKDKTIVASTTDYGAPFVSAVARDNVIACQFHPEKSQGAGLGFLKRFIEQC